MNTLRTGFTTGTYAAATAVAAWQCLNGMAAGSAVDILFPDGRYRQVNVDGCARRQNGAEACAIKKRATMWMRTYRNARAACPALPETVFVRIGDFIRKSCEMAADLGFREVTVCCMPGTSVKLRVLSTEEDQWLI